MGIIALVPSMKISETESFHEVTSTYHTYQKFL